MKKLFFCLLFSTLAFACSNSNENEVAKVSGLEEILLNTEEVLNSVDTSETFALYREVKHNLKFIQNNYSDTMQKDDAFTLGDYNANRKALYFFVENYNKFNNEIELSKNQLNNLKTDLANNTINIDDFPNYFETEQQIIIELNNQVSTAVNGINTVISNYKDLTPKVNKIIADIKTQQSE